MEIGFIGLGNLGKVMVQNLIDKKHKLHLYNRTETKMEPFREYAGLHKDIPSLAQACDIILSTVQTIKHLNLFLMAKKGW